MEACKGDSTRDLRAGLRVDSYFCPPETSDVFVRVVEVAADSESDPVAQMRSELSDLLRISGGAIAIAGICMRRADDVSDALLNGALSEIKRVGHCFGAVVSVEQKVIMHFNHGSPGVN